QGGVPGGGEGGATAKSRALGKIKRPLPLRRWPFFLPRNGGTVEGFLLPQPPLHPVEHSAGDELLTLTIGDLQQGDDLPATDFDRKLRRPLPQALLELVNHYRHSRFDEGVIGRILEDQRQDAEVAEVGLM